MLNKSLNKLLINRLINKNLMTTILSSNTLMKPDNNQTIYEFFLFNRSGVCLVHLDLQEDQNGVLNRALNFDMGIGDWGLGIGPNPQSPIPNPQSPISFIKFLLKNFE
jgi:hypothetical protein